MSKKNRMVPVYCLDQISEEIKQAVLESMVQYWMERGNKEQEKNNLF